ncbi:hypothetical protein [Dactylosporangium sp. NPDC051484]|uniref:hypothetical protein n=1 Tax=Dactylosporangium sp. NPDC051484 TaxID=3154942 RepID=UPI00344F89CF
MEWTDLGKAITQRRVELGHHTLVSFSKIVGLSTRILGDLEGGRRDSYDPATLVRIERALRWPAGTVDAVLAGRPVPTDPQAVAVTLSASPALTVSGSRNPEPSRREIHGGQPIRQVRVGDTVISRLADGRVSVENIGESGPDPESFQPSPPERADNERRIIHYDPDDTSLPGLHLPPGYDTWRIPHPLAGLILLLDDPRLTPPKRRQVLLALEQQRLMIGAMLNVNDLTPEEQFRETVDALGQGEPKGRPVPPEAPVERREPPKREQAMREKPVERHGGGRP